MLAAVADKTKRRNNTLIHTHGGMEYNAIWGRATLYTRATREGWFGKMVSKTHARTPQNVCAGEYNFPDFHVCVCVRESVYALKL